MAVPGLAMCLPNFRGDAYGKCILTASSSRTATGSMRTVEGSIPSWCRLPPKRSQPYPILGPSFSKPRPKDSWVFWGSALGLIEEAVEFAAGRIEGALLLFRAVVDQWAAVGPNHIMNKFLGRDLS